MTTDSKYLHSVVANVILQHHHAVRNVLSLRLTLEAYKRALSGKMELHGLTVLCNKQADIVYKDRTVSLLLAKFFLRLCCGNADLFRDYKRTVRP